MTGIRFVRSTGEWKVKTGITGGSGGGGLIRLSDRDFQTLVEGLSGYKWHKVKEENTIAYCNELYALMDDDLPRDWFDELVEMCKKYHLVWQDYVRAKRRKVSSGYYPLRKREYKEHPYEEAFLERYNWNVRCAIMRDRFDWFVAAQNEKSKFYKQAKLTEDELRRMWEEAKK